MGIVAKLSPDGSTLLYSTYLTGVDRSSLSRWPAPGFGSSIAVASSGSAYVAGFTSAATFPTTAGAYSTCFIDGERYQVFVTQLDATGTGLAYSTYLGAGFPSSVALDGQSNMYVSGVTWDPDFPTTTGAFSTSYRGHGDAFALKMALLGGEGYSISGRVTADSGASMAGVTVADNRGHIATTGDEGSYALRGLSPCTYEIRPSGEYASTPSSGWVTVPPSATGQDFVLDAEFTASGRVTYSITPGVAIPVQGVAIAVDGEHRSSTDPSGYFTITGLLAGDHSVTPSTGDYLFWPVSRTVHLTSDVDRVDFLGLIPNDDADEDALLNSWEIQGYHADGGDYVDLPAMGANPLRKDIFVEVDYMGRAEYGANSRTYRPKEEAIERVVRAFASAPVPNSDGSTGIELHMDNGRDSVMIRATGEKWRTRSRSNSIPWRETVTRWATHGRQRPSTASKTRTAISDANAEGSSTTPFSGTNLAETLLPAPAGSRSTTRAATSPCALAPATSRSP